MKSFSSDNSSGVHPEIMNAIINVNKEHVSAYGHDYFTEKAENKFKEVFGNDIEVFFVYNGTGANITALTSMTNSFNSIICSNVSHINVDECGAPEKFSGCKLLPLKSVNGKLTIDEIEKTIHVLGVEHHSQPKVISLTQSTEYGTLYSIEELKRISLFAKQYNMYIHMDGARISNASVALNVDLKTITADCGVDVLSFGGTKNGLMYGEAVIFFNKDLAQNFKYIRKQSTQLASKMRFISAQFEALLSNDLWKRNAKHSNDMAQMLFDLVSEIPEVKVTQPVQVNSVFAILPKDIISKLQDKFHFYTWDESISEVRWMCSFDTTKEDVISFVETLKSLLK